MRKLFLILFFASFNCFSQTKKDTLYILFEEGLHGMKKHRMFQYKDHDPKYYYINYKIPVYWKQENLNNDDSYTFEGYYDHMFWYGTYKINPKFPEFDDAEIYGTSLIVKKHMSFLRKNKNKLLDYEWFKKRTPPDVWDILKPHKNREYKPVLFLIDKNEFTQDSIVLRNVMYQLEIIQ